MTIHMKHLLVILTTIEKFNKRTFASLATHSKIMDKDCPGKLLLIPRAKTTKPKEQSLWLKTLKKELMKVNRDCII